LDIGRSELRAYLAGIGAVWFNDPMNQDERFGRVRIRKLLPTLEAAGLPPWRLRQAAEHLARAREALEVTASAFLNSHARLERDHALIDGGSLAQIPREIALRALCTVLSKIGGATYRPRFARLEAVLDAVLEDKLARQSAQRPIAPPQKGRIRRV
jgi:tRNA(Ile)-lysidine synthase